MSEFHRCTTKVRSSVKWNATSTRASLPIIRCARTLCPFWTSSVRSMHGEIGCSWTWRGRGVDAAWTKKTCFSFSVCGHVCVGRTTRTDFPETISQLRQARLNSFPSQTSFLASISSWWSLLTYIPSLTRSRSCVHEFHTATDRLVFDGFTITRELLPPHSLRFLVPSFKPGLENGGHGVWRAWWTPPFICRTDL